MVDGEEEADRGGEIAVPSILHVIAICFRAWIDGGSERGNR